MLKLNIKRWGKKKREGKNSSQKKSDREEGKKMLKEGF